MSRMQTTPAPLARTPARVPVRGETTRVMRTKAGREIDPVTGKKKANPVDAHIGARVRMRRMLLSMSQEKLGDALSLTFQQVQKYEKGTNRIGGSRMQQIATVLKCDVAYFYEGAPGATRPDGTPIAAVDDAITKFMSNADGLRIAQRFTLIRSEKTRHILANLIVSMSMPDDD